MRTEDGYIIHRCLSGDSSAFGFLVDKYRAGVYACAYEKLQNFHDAEDIAQEVFLKAYVSLRTLRRWDSFASWLYRITLNLCRGRFRAQSSRPDGEFIEDQEPELLQNHSRDLYRQELVCESVREALDSLPEMYSQVLTLHYLGGMTSMEIARFTGVSPSAIRMRLRKARSLLKEEILAMISTTFEEQKLQSTFTLRIAEAVKKMKIQPMPRTAGLPWGLSLATGIVLAILNFSPYPGILNQTATGSPLPGETKVLRIGEIPVDLLKISQVSVLSSEQRDNDKPIEPYDDTLMVAHDEVDTRMYGAASGNDVIIDPETGARYTKTKTLAGKSDVCDYYCARLSLSPNGKFLLWGTLVIPLDGGEPFYLADLNAWNGSWSPDGEKAVFYSSGAVWVIPVSPETGQAAGPARKLLGDGEYGRAIQWVNPSWSPDSQKIVFQRKDAESGDGIWTLSVTDGTLTEITDAQGRDPIWSPDGKTIAYKIYKEGYEIWLVSIDGGAPRKVSSGKERLLHWTWSPDSEWLVYTLGGKLRFFHLADEHKIDITRPESLGEFFSWSPDGKKLLFYHSSYDWRSILKVVSASGGPSTEFGRNLTLWAYDQFWSPDGKTIVTQGESEDGDYGFWILPLEGSKPSQLELDVSVPGEPNPLSLSPTCSKLLFSVKQNGGAADLWVVSISLEDGRTTGSAVMVFSGWVRSPRYRTFSWSPDGKKLAVIYEGDVWIASAEGGKPIQITKTPEDEREPLWSPDGGMIAYIAYHSEQERDLMVISESGGEPMKILDITHGSAEYTWSPDGKELAILTSGRAYGKEGMPFFRDEGMISAISITDGKSRRILDLKDQPVDQIWGITWSPNGSEIAFVGWNEEGELRHQVFVIPAEGGEVTGVAAESGSVAAIATGVSWSPDGKWMSYAIEGPVKIRPEGEIWEADVSELLSGAEKEQ